jgi:hypothetical protein
VGGEVSKQRNAAVEFLAEAERHNGTAALCIAQRTLGTTCVTTGEFAGCGISSKHERSIVRNAMLACVFSIART